MTLFLATKLSVAECADHLSNAIDPVPSTEERVRSANDTTWRPDPLPGAGWRATGFGYAPGTRPVVGTIADGRFGIEKRVLQGSYGRGRGARAVIGMICAGQLQPAPYGTLIELEIQPSGGSVATMFIAGLVAAVGGLICLSALLPYLAGAYAAAPTPKGAAGGTAFGFCLVVPLLLVPASILLSTFQSGQAEREYLLTFVKQVCHATTLEAPAAEGHQEYTGKTRRLS